MPVSSVKTGILTQNKTKAPPSHQVSTNPEAHWPLATEVECCWRHGVFGQDCDLTSPPSREQFGTREKVTGEQMWGLFCYRGHSKDRVSLMNLVLTWFSYYLEEWLGNYFPLWASMDLEPDGATSVIQLWYFCIDLCIDIKIVLT